jgi:site-specific DNA-methyltransferase (adenine-specific)
MPYLSDDSIHLVVTSPPYWQIKDYGTKEQIGFHDSYETYINNLNLVWQEVYRVLKSGCRLCINIGDQFARAVFYGRYKVIPIRTEIIKFCESIGFDYMGAILWQKRSTTNTTGGANIMGSYPYPRNGILKLDYEYILVFKKPGKTAQINSEFRLLSKLSKSEWHEYFSGHWQIPGNKQKEHLASFPLEIPNRLIKMYSFVQDIILDPFLGSGTTALSALNLGRHSVGIEINKHFLPQIKERLGFKTAGADFEFDFNMIQQDLNQKKLKDRLDRLPYKFSDPHPLVRNHMENDSSFGSKINGNEVSSQNYYSVSEILEADLIRLSNGRNLRLLGIITKPEHKMKAIQYLKKKTTSRQVFVKFDRIKEDEEGNWLGYLFLKNKTFINAHMIKSGLAQADTVKKYRHRKRFEQYQKNKKNKSE